MDTCRVRGEAAVIPGGHRSHTYLAFSPYNFVGKLFICVKAKTKPLKYQRKPP